MSYEIIRSIKIKDNKVYIHGTANNVRPYDWNEWECPHLTKILQEQSQEALDIEILKAYEEGNFQRGNNKYTRALKVLRHMPEYKDFDWRGDGFHNGHRDTPAYEELLKRAMRTYLPKDKFIIIKEYNGKPVYLHRLTKHHADWTYNKKYAKIFHYEEDAQLIKKWFTNSEPWRVEKLRKDNLCLQLL